MWSKSLIIREIARNCYRRAIRVAPRSADSYATHLPILFGLSDILRPRKIVECGSGMNSTVQFLDRQAFPLLETLVSIETDSEWLDKVRERVNGDGRVHFILEPDAARALSDTLLHDADLVFIDDSYADRRVGTIRAVSRLYEGPGILVVHDYEIAIIRRAAREMPTRFAFNALNPQTGVLSRGKVIETARLTRLNEIVRRYRNELSLEDSAGWRRAFAREM
jgi:predicted O-methyltransferase YrrM